MSVILQRHHNASSRQQPPCSRRVNPIACWRCGFAAGIVHPSRQQHPPQLLVLHATSQEDGARPGSETGSSSSGSSDSGSGWLEPGSSWAAEQQAEQRGAAPPQAGQQAGGNDGDDADDNEKYNLGVRLALGGLFFYREVISPLMPSRCRYVPSCSKYSIQAFKEFGVVQGGVLTAWRLARCQPLGGPAWSYDPPSWPPVGLEFMYRPGGAYVAWLAGSNAAVLGVALYLHHLGWL